MSPTGGHPAADGGRRPQGGALDLFCVTVDRINTWVARFFGANRDPTGAALVRGDSRRGPLDPVVDRVANQVDHRHLDGLGDPRLEPILGPTYGVMVYQEQVMRMARDISNREIRKDQFVARAEALVQQYPEYQSLSWVDERRQIISTHSVSNLLHSPPLRVGEALPLGDTETHYSLSRDLMQPIYGVITAEKTKDAPLPMLQLHTPLTNDKGQFNGVLMAEYPLESLLRYGIPTEILAKYAVSLVSAEGETLAGQTIPARRHPWPAFPWPSPAANEFRVPVSPVGNGLLLRAQAWRTSTGLVGNAQFWMAVALSVMTAWMLIANWRHTRRRLQAQKALVAETSFRRAMENSMLTGMRALDLEGRITYVNPAFCEMTGWSEHELVGATAPFPYWPEQDHDFPLHAHEFYFKPFLDWI